MTAAGEERHFDADRVRIELCESMSAHIADGESSMSVVHSAEIWLSDKNGKIVRTRKPSAVLVGDSRPEVLRMLAAWMQDQNDISLAGLVARIRTLT